MFVHVLKIWYSANCTIGRRNSYLVTECKWLEPWIQRADEDPGLFLKEWGIFPHMRNKRICSLPHMSCHMHTCNQVKEPWTETSNTWNFEKYITLIIRQMFSLSLFLSHFKHIPTSLFSIWKNEGTELSTCRLLSVWRLTSYSRVFSPVCCNVRHHIPDPRISVKQAFGKVRNHRQVAYELCWRTTLSLHICIKHLHLLTLLILTINFQHIKSEFIRVSL